MTAVPPRTPSRRQALLALVAGAAAAADWPRFRGPDGDGSSAERGLPLKWGPDENVVWKAKLPGPGSSGPVVHGDRVFVTCYSGYTERSGDRAALRRHLVCLDRAGGKVLWQKDVVAKQPEAEFKTQVNQHGFATSTPATDGSRVYVNFNRGGFFAFDMDGNPLWEADLGKGVNGFGSASSPVLYKGLVLVNATVECSKLLALDKATGKVVWKASINGDSWATPALVEAGGGVEVVLNGTGAVYGFDADTGKELWSCDTGHGGTPGGTPVVRKDVVYVLGAGIGGREVLALRAGGRGDVSKSHVVWRNGKVGAGLVSPVVVGERLYFFANGQAVCVGLERGEEVYRERLETAANEYSSPVAADGRIYLFSRGGAAYVLAAGATFERLARNDLGDASGFTTGPAVSHRCLFVRTAAHLYCLGARE